MSGSGGQERWTRLGWAGGAGWAEEWGWGCSVWLESWSISKMPLAEGLSGA